VCRALGMPVGCRSSVREAVLMLPRECTPPGRGLGVPSCRAVGRVGLSDTCAIKHVAVRRQARVLSPHPCFARQAVSSLEARRVHKRFSKTRNVPHWRASMLSSGAHGRGEMRHQNERPIAPASQERSAETVAAIRSRNSQMIISRTLVVRDGFPYCQHLRCDVELVFCASTFRCALSIDRVTRLCSSLTLLAAPAVA